MSRFAKTIILAILAVAALVWACSYSFSGLAWFPGFVCAVFFGLKILDLNQEESR